MKKLKWLIVLTGTFFVTYTGMLVRTQDTKLEFIDELPVDTLKEVVEDKERKQEVTSHLIKQQLNMVWELTTVKYNYSGACSVESSKTVNGLTIPLTKRVLIFTYDGYIKAGLDLDEALIEVTDNVIYVTLPEVTIQDNVILEDTIKVIDQNSNVLNPLEFEDTMKIIAREKTKMATRAIDNHLLEDARRNAEVLISSTLNVFGLQIKFN